MQEKKDIRKNILQKRDVLLGSELQAKSDAIYQKFIVDLDYQKADFIYLYMNFKSEVITKNMIAHAHKAGKKVAIPKIIDGEMQFYYFNEGETLQEGYFGIREPNATIPVADDNAVMVVPGVAFDTKGYRIGYGKGFYDRFLSRHKVKKKIAFAFEVQMIEQVPYDTHDIPVDMIITENRTIVV